MDARASRAQSLRRARPVHRQRYRSAPLDDPRLGSWPVVRRKSMAGFPYGVIYCGADGEVVIVAYAHERRLPG